MRFWFCCQLDRLRGLRPSKGTFANAQVDRGCVVDLTNEDVELRRTSEAIELGAFLVGLNGPHLFRSGIRLVQLDRPCYRRPSRPHRFRAVRFGVGRALTTSLISQPPIFSRSSVVNPELSPEAAHATLVPNSYASRDVPASTDSPRLPFRGQSGPYS